MFNTCRSPLRGTIVSFPTVVTDSYIPDPLPALGIFTLDSQTIRDIIVKIWHLLTIQEHVLCVKLEKIYPLRYRQAFYLYFVLGTRKTFFRVRGFLATCITCSHILSSIHRYYPNVLELQHLRNRLSDERNLSMVVCRNT